MSRCWQELNTLEPNDAFRLWMTAEVHVKFPTILLQSSLKVTYEVNDRFSFSIMPCLVLVSCVCRLLQESDAIWLVRMTLGHQTSSPDLPQQLVPKLSLSWRGFTLLYRNDAATFLRLVLSWQMLLLWMMELLIGRDGPNSMNFRLLTSEQQQTLLTACVQPQVRRSLLHSLLAGHRILGNGLG